MSRLCRHIRGKDAALFIDGENNPDIVCGSDSELFFDQRHRDGVEAYVDNRRLARIITSNLPVQPPVFDNVCTGDLIEKFLDLPLGDKQQVRQRNTHLAKHHRVQMCIRVAIAPIVCPASHTGPLSDERRRCACAWAAAWNPSY